MSRILIVEDDLFLQDGLRELFSRENIESETVVSVGSAKALLDQENFDLIVLDVTLPDGTGYKLCHDIRQQNNPIPILFLTAKDEFEDLREAFERGADDFMTKPFKAEELVYRVKALLKRTAQNNDSEKKANLRIKAGALELDLDMRKAYQGGANIDLTPTEFSILYLLLENRGRVVSREKILDYIWLQDEDSIDTNTLNVHVSRLRRKLPQSKIKTIRGVGYLWEA
jgi:two-component system response regulator RegX3